MAFRRLNLFGGKPNLPAGKRIMDAFEHILALRLRDSARVRIQDIARGAPDLRRMSAQLETAIAQNHAALLAQFEDDGTREDMAARMAAGMFAFLAEQYQYLELGDVQRADLHHIYRRFVAETHDWLRGVTSALTDCPPLAAHHERLSAWTRSRLADVDALDWADTADGAIVCGAYGARLQLDLLGLDPADLKEPILDLGCGRTAALVVYLRQIGRDVTGVDRLAETGSDLIQGSWFDAPLAPSSWGTIIAHHSFSLHFLNAHLGKTERAVRYARHYMHILDALEPGGQFAYAPGLDFIENHLDPDRFEVTHRQIDIAEHVPKDAIAPTRWHATRIIRLTA